MTNFSDNIDIYGDNLFEVIKQVCPHCKQVNQYINAQHLDDEYDDKMIRHMKGELEKAKKVIIGYEEFCQEHRLLYGLAYELNQLREKFNRKDDTPC